MATTVFPEAGDQITEAAWSAANKTIAGADAYRVTGYALSAGSGLNANVSAGTCFVEGYRIVSDAVQAVAVTGSSTNYIWLNADGTLSHNTTGTNPGSELLLGTATTDGSGVTAVDHYKDVESTVWAIKRKAADEDKTTDTTLAVDDTLFWTAGGAGESWLVELIFIFSEGGGDFKFDLAGLESKGYVYWQGGDPATATINTPVSITTGSSQQIYIRGVFTTSGAGSVGLEWAQDTSNAAATTVVGGSSSQPAMLTARRILS